MEFITLLYPVFPVWEIQHHDFDIRVSTPERAFMEMLPEVPRNLSFHHADQLMERMTTLFPRRIQQILEVSPNVKVKRLFLWFAERDDHPWFKKLDLNQINWVVVIARSKKEGSWIENTYNRSQ